MRKQEVGFFSSYPSDIAQMSTVIRSPDQPPVTVVCFLGGCTYTELSALRFVSNQGRGESVSSDEDSLTSGQAGARS